MPVPKHPYVDEIVAELIEPPIFQILILAFIYANLKLKTDKTSYQKQQLFTDITVKLSTRK